jgi:hypothetical protein
MLGLMSDEEEIPVLKMQLVLFCDPWVASLNRKLLQLISHNRLATLLPD